jgi:hypothetical protein
LNEILPTVALQYVDVGEVWTGFRECIAIQEVMLRVFRTVRSLLRMASLASARLESATYDRGRDVFCLARGVKGQLGPVETRWE